ncbi:acyl--CoA ligase [Arthrobacter sp. I2-34]|uniref:Acyl--CoA ligase n=1 Tax=Arthrobacter hankyongi TaxID=2904801 RepID=A0ABS9L3F7_9MICC|nr:class I adenylate-forming enzyme family protein [Arthrobacter hankyongi]MCG2621211.1 acyl--CoA ligase [Arthrobacter hankyongi]
MTETVRHADPSAPAVRWGTETVEEAYLGHPGRQYRDRPRSVLQMLDTVPQWAERAFIVQGERRIRYGTFLAAVDEGAAILERNGVVPGSRVLLFAYNSPEFVLAVWAIWRAGGVPVMGNRWWSQAEIDNAMALTHPVVALTDFAGLEAGAARRVMLSELSPAFDAAPGVPGHRSERHEGGEDDVALVIFTSGSTGVPKAVSLSQRSVIANQHNLLLRSRQLPQDLDPEAPQTVSLVCTPLFHVGGVSNLITQPIIGGRLVLNEGKFDPVQVLQIIEREGVHRWGGVPTMAGRVLEHPDLEKYDLSSLRSFPLGGAPLSPQLLDRLRSKLPQLERRGLANTWGMTESGGFITVAGNRDLAQRPGTVGSPYPIAELRIDNPDEHGVGEILVRCPTVMTGYVGLEDDATVDGDGWLHTGDLGHLDEDGFLYLDGRSKDIVIRGGENIACRHVEQALLEHPDVYDVAVVGVPHADLGEEVAAVVVLRAGAEPTSEMLRDFVKPRLAYFEVPSRWFLQRDELPTLPGEKVDKRTIRAELEARLGGGSAR